ncbi:hypothetical protein BU16DRAFT_551599 [Lophium mytilinum]|uniref:DUF4419 domain-containing protein n=1 Tax=Lophium mytilinum TaxID=390894 RepID=A0A6A6QK87_9PEZI|nr:hypothetical protein BU16DRAFT_551599 [Lophium mytilinum]
MPVTIRPSPEQAETRKILASSFDDLNANSTTLLIPYGNGLVNGIIRAFQQDLHLVLRPDDIWLSILTQFNMYVNANAEKLRRLFVAHEGKKELVIDVRPATIAQLDFGKLSQDMADLIGKNVVDPELKRWIMPRFTTTTHDDKSVAAMVMMGTLQKYFDYTALGGCGFPSVTLMGEQADWEEILRRVKRLPRYGPETAEWSSLLVPIIRRFIATFSAPDSQALKDFWLRVHHSAGVDGSGERETYSGWITAFCFWHHHKYTRKIMRVESVPHDLDGVDRKQLVLDGVAYPIIAPESIPDGVVSVPVKVKDFAEEIEYATTFIAGSVGMTGMPSGGRLSTVQPRSGWWMLQDSCKPLGS